MGERRNSFRQAATPRGDNAILTLLQALLTGLRASQDTPLNFGGETAEIARAAWRDFLQRTNGRIPGDAEAVCARLDELLANRLDDGAKFQKSPDDARRTSCESFHGNLCTLGIAYDERADPADEARLAAWLSQTDERLRGVDSRAVEIVDLRVAGADDREISERLGLGLRLVQHLVHSLQEILRVVA